VKRAKGMREWAAVWALALLMAGVMLVPEAARRRDERPGWRFQGIVSDQFVDAAHHLAWVRQAHDGQVLFESKFAGADVRTRRFFNPLFLAMGHAARLAHLSLPQVLIAERFLVAVLVLVAVYWFAAEFFADRRMRWTCLLLATFGAGLEWTWTTGLTDWRRYAGLPLESNLFRSLSMEAIVGPATGLVLAVLVFAHRALEGMRKAERGMRNGAWRGLIPAGVSIFVLASVHPHDLVTVFAVLTVLAVVQRQWGRGARVLGVMALCAAPLVLYDLSVIQAEPAFRDYVHAVHPEAVARALPFDFGLTLVLALVGAAAIVRRRERDRALLVIWPALIVAALLTPPRTHRCFLYHGLPVVLAALATRGLWDIGNRLYKRRTPASPGADENGVRPQREDIQGSAPIFTGSRRRAGVIGVALVIGVASITNVVRFGADLRRQAPAQPYYLTDDEAQALDYLDSAAAPTAVIGCLAPTGEYIPVRTGSRVYVGNAELSLDYHQREHRMERLMGKTGRLSPDDARTLIDAGRLDYLYVDPGARELGSRDEERMWVEAGLATPVFERPGAAVYRVVGGATF
jgi:hypothetical protein